MKTLEDLIRHHAFFRGLPDELVAFIAGCGQNVVFPAGAFVLREGEPADRFYLLRHGHVVLELYLPGRGPQSFMTLGPDEVLGVSWLVEPYVWNHDARAVEQVRAIAFDAECLRAKCEAEAEVGYALMKRFVPILMERLHVARLASLDLYGRRA